MRLHLLLLTKDKTQQALGLAPLVSVFFFPFSSEAEEFGPLTETPTRGLCRNSRSSSRQSEYRPIKNRPSDNPKRSCWE